MAVIDTDASEIVIRMVYDGPPEAGKTTSLRALAGSLSQPTFTPAEDANGRTLWFDWMEYVGGRFEGCQIRCQILTVPGQRELAARRRRVLSGADVVVFVADSARRELPTTLAYMRELHDMLATAESPVGVILQANKRDLDDAAPLAELRRALNEANFPVGVVESVAAEGTGIREAFVYAVRLALDRVRDLMTNGALRVIPTGARGADELLEAMRADDRARYSPTVMEPSETSPAAELLREVLAAEHTPPPRPPLRPPPPGAPRPPDSSVPSGAIWPPVEGRAILCELDPNELIPRRLSNGDWAAGLGSGWRVVSGRDSVFPTLDQGRAALIQWARLHASAAGAISLRRCIVVADDGNQGWRLWQIIRTDDSLREVLERALHEHTGTSLVSHLSRTVDAFLDAHDKLAHLPVALPCNLDAIGGFESGAVYIGLMPDPTTNPVEPQPRPDPRAMLRDQLEAAIGAELRDRGLDLKDILHLEPAVPQRGDDPHDSDDTAGAATALLGA